ncbi:LolA family protein [Halorussus pelagicus]|uniref:LolA family protein n=1 Tax=Halorussus pelagicus TaxID=2505977 RepID=UPI000FFBCCB8|nr:hypothetical protein [Halorussus pelagicus]
MTTNDDTPSVKEILDELQSTDNLPDTIHGTKRKTEKYGGGLRTVRLEVWEDLPNRTRNEQLSVETADEFDFDLGVMHDPTPEFEGVDLMIQNRDGVIMYDREAKKYHSLDFNPAEDQPNPNTDATLIGSSPKSNFDVTYDGRETVAGRETHVLSFRPTADADSLYRGYEYINMWIDDEYWFPIKEEAQANIQKMPLLQTDSFEDIPDGVYFLKKTFEEVEFDIEIDRSLFEFTPPENAKEVK